MPYIDNLIYFTSQIIKNLQTAPREKISLQQ